MGDSYIQPVVGVREGVAGVRSLLRRNVVKTCRLVNNWIKVPNLEDKKGGNPFEWPEDVRVREFPEVR